MATSKSHARYTSWKGKTIRGRGTVYTNRKYPGYGILVTGAGSHTLLWKGKPWEMGAGASSMKDAVGAIRRSWDDLFAPYYSVIIPWHSARPTDWHPTSKAKSPLSRGAFKTAKAAHAWAREKRVASWPYSVERYDPMKDSGLATMKAIRKTRQLLVGDRCACPPKRTGRGRRAKAASFPEAHSYGGGKYSTTLKVKKGSALYKWINANKGKDGEIRLDISTTGRGWNVIRSIRGMVITENFAQTGKKLTAENSGKLFLGERSLSSPKESGYQMSGKVSFGGKKYNAFTSSTLVEMPSGQLVNIGVIFASLPTPTLRSLLRKHRV